MNAIGFLKRYNPGYRCAKSEIKFRNTELHGKILEKVIKYLSEGIVIASYTISFYDDDGDFIGPFIIYTDGEWIWPGYFIHYLKKYRTIDLPEQFLDHVENKVEVPKLSELEEKYAQYFLFELTGINRGIWKAPAELQQMLTVRGEKLTCY